MVRDYNARGIKITRALEIAMLSSHQYYYRSKAKKAGRRPSKVTRYRNPQSGDEFLVDNIAVVDKVVAIKMDPDHANYYKLITKTLCLMGYFINHKKVYRLMYEYLLLEERSKQTGKKYVEHRRALPNGPMHILEMDIKHIRIAGSGKQAFVLTVIDTFTRYVLHWSVGYSMKSVQVEEVWNYIVANYIQPLRKGEEIIEIEVRNDNGPQFASGKIQDFFEQNELVQVFTHPYTPQENGHIESFHAKLSKSLKEDVFENLTGLEKRLNLFYVMYNNKRSHGQLKGLPPAIFWALYEKKQISVSRNEEKRKYRLELHVAYQDILGLEGINKYKYRVIRA